MNRQEFRKLAIIRLKEARILMDNGKYCGAYYLCGYALECGLKACISKKIRRSQFPDFKFAKESWTHSLLQLIKTAALFDDLEKKRKSDKKFRINWGLAKDWSSESRYKRCDKKKATDFYNAVADPNSGVFQWIKLNW